MDKVCELIPLWKPEMRAHVDAGTLPSDASARNEYPMADGLLYYFPSALAAVARVSKIGNDQHNPGEPMHHARGKSTDHENKIIRHLVDAGTLDTDGTRHSAKVAWRALALLQEELEREEGAPLPRNARLPTA
ncbi:MAG: dATP/dGTP diphosphohydrolase domain-containing protein [Rhodanobacteraceae bacterium]